MTKARACDDRRANEITLTQLGLEMIELAMHVVPRRRLHHKLFQGIFRVNNVNRNDKLDGYRTDRRIYGTACVVQDLANELGRFPSLVYAPFDNP
jgi:hypothetical protein